jgi:hypothetical protein
MVFGDPAAGSGSAKRSTGLIRLGLTSVPPLGTDGAEQPNVAQFRERGVNQPGRATDLRREERNIKDVPRPTSGISAAERLNSILCGHSCQPPSPGVNAPKRLSRAFLFESSKRIVGALPRKCDSLGPRRGVLY